MEVTRVICPYCNKEHTHKKDIRNLRVYSEEIISKPCEDCKDTPEAKLLEAIFGGYLNGNIEG